MIFLTSVAICTVSLTPELLDDRRHVVRLDVRPVVVVDGDDRRPAAAAETLDRAERHFAVFGGLAGVPTELRLRKPQCREHRALRVGRVLRALRLNRVVQRAHRSTSPMTVSREPTIAIMSAINASCIIVAVASSATNEGARNLTRHGFGPPSEQR